MSGHVVFLSNWKNHGASLMSLSMTMIGCYCELLRLVLACSMQYVHLTKVFAKPSMVNPSSILPKLHI